MTDTHETPGSRDRNDGTAESTGKRGAGTAPNSGGPKADVVGLLGAIQTALEYPGVEGTRVLRRLAEDLVGAANPKVASNKNHDHAPSAPDCGAVMEATNAQYLRTLMSQPAYVEALRGYDLIVEDGVPAGAWVVYDHNHGPYAESLHPHATAASHAAAKQGYGRVAFWPYGTSLGDAVRAWEAQ